MYLCKKNLFVQRCTDIEHPAIENIWLKIRSHNKSFHILRVYNPSNVETYFGDSLHECVQSVKDKGFPTFSIAGYFNRLLTITDSRTD